MGVVVAGAQKSSMADVGRALEGFVILDQGRNWGVGTNSLVFGGTRDI